MITIIQTDGVCELYPWISELGKHLRCKRREYLLPSVYKERLKDAIAKGKSPGSVSKFENISTDLYRVDSNNHAFFMSGLLPRVEKVLKDKNIPYQISRQVNEAIRPRPDWTRLGELRGRQLEVLATIAVSDGGVINAATGYGKSYIIRQICAMYPTLNILIISKAQSVVRELAQAVEETCPGEVGYIYGGMNTSVGKRILVTTTRSMHKVPEEEVHLLLFDECHAVGQNDSADQLSRFLYCRRFGFTATPFRSDGTAVMMESFFGPHLIDIDYEESVDSGNVTQLSYLMLDVPYGPNFIEDDINAGQVKSNIFKKRWAYWRNIERNTTIAECVKECQKRDLQVLVMVDTLEHAVLLHQYLPDIPVIHYGKQSEDSFEDLANSLINYKFMAYAFQKYAEDNELSMESPEDKHIVVLKYLNETFGLDKNTKNKLKDDLAAGKIRACISTMTLKEGVNLNQLNVLIRADGVSSKVYNSQIPGRLSRLWPDKKRGLLIDFNDSWTPWAANSSRAREMTYQTNKWQKRNTLEELLEDAHYSSSDSSDESNA